MLQEKKSRLTGISAIKSHILAAKTVANIIKTSLGPRGMDKILVSPDGDVTVTNDGGMLPGRAGKGWQCLARAGRAELGQDGAGTGRGIQRLRVASVLTTTRACFSFRPPPLPLSLPRPSPCHTPLPAPPLSTTTSRSNHSEPNARGAPDCQAARAAEQVPGRRNRRWHYRCCWYGYWCKGARSAALLRGRCRTSDVLGPGCVRARFLVLAGALLEYAEQLLDRGVHPMKIADGYERACRVAVERLDQIGDKIEFDRDNIEPLLKTAMTSLGSKMCVCLLAQMPLPPPSPSC